jgi:hypothetical protein
MPFDPPFIDITSHAGEAVCGTSFPTERGEGA